MGRIGDASFQSLSQYPHHFILQQGIEWPVLALRAVVAGSKIPYWISHQSSGCEAELELPPNWFNTIFVGFSLGAVASLVAAYCLFLPIMKCTLFYSTPSHVSFSPTASHFARRMKSDHMWLLHVPYIRRINMHEVSHIKASFEFMMMSNYAIKRCGVAPAYRNKAECDKYRRMIQFNSNFPPRPHSSTPVLEKIEEGEPNASGCSRYGSESLNTTHHCWC